MRRLSKLKVLFGLLVFFITSSVQALIITPELEVIRVLDVGDSFETVNSQQSYADMIVVCTYALPSDGDNEALVRIDNITGSSFDVRIQNPEGDDVTAADVYCILADEGDWTLPDGTFYEAHSVESDGTYGWNRGWETLGGANGAEDVSAEIDATDYADDDARPAVLGQVMSYNDTEFSVFHSFDCESRTRPPFWGDGMDTALEDGLCVAKHVSKTPGDGTDPTHASNRDDETLGYIVIEQDIGSFAGIDYRSALGADTVAGVDNSPPYTYGIGAHYDYGVATQEAEDGSHGSWAVLYGTDPLDGNNIDLAVDEDTLSSNRGHTDEQVAYWVFAGTDHGDAPSTYLDASHKVTGDLSLGAVANGDPDAELVQYSDDADADDAVASGEVDDEDGVVFRSDSDGSIFADVEVNNFTGASVNVCAWLDVPSGGVVDGSFDSIDGQCQSIATGTTTATFEWPGLPNDQQYTTFARFRVTSDTITDGNAASGTTASNGEVEDYQVIFNFEPTSVAIGRVEIQNIAVNSFLEGIGVPELTDSELLNLLHVLDPSSSLDSSASRADVAGALNGYLDPDGDNLVALFSWDTREQRGTIGFYVERLQDDQSWHRVNDELLPAVIAAPMGAEYQLLDPTASPIEAGDSSSYYYRLIEVEVTGQTRVYGPFELSL